MKKLQMWWSMIVPLVFLLVMFVGWGMNIYKVVETAGGDIYSGLFIARVIGIFIAPIGSILGFF